jgi:integrase
VIHVEQGKGGRDRYVMLSPQLLGILRSYWRLARPVQWLFPGRDPEHPIHPVVLHAACRSACAASGLGKRVTVHTLRHYVSILTMSGNTPSSAILTVKHGLQRVEASPTTRHSFADFAVCRESSADDPEVDSDPAYLTAMRFW